MKDLIKFWEEKIYLLEVLIAANDKTTEHGGDMLAIMIGRKNQIEECIKDLKDAITTQ